jgi:putative membrane protein
MGAEGHRTVFLLMAAFIFVAAERRASAVVRRLHTHQVSTIKITNIRIIAIVGVLATLSLVAVIWLLQIKPLY